MLTQPRSRTEETIYVAAAVAIFVVSSLLTAVAFRCFPSLDLLFSLPTTVTAHTKETASDTAFVSRFPSTSIPLE